MSKPRKAKVHARRIAELYVRTGWKLVREFVDDEGCAYEYYLEWTDQDEPIEPDLTKAEAVARRRPT